MHTASDSYNIRILDTVGYTLIISTDKLMTSLHSKKLDLREQARTLAKQHFKHRAMQIDRSEAYPWENVDLLVEQSLMGMTIPKDYGGLGVNYLDVALIVEEIAKVCGVTARIVVEGNMGAISAIMKYGTEHQKQLAARLVLAGDKPAICITEPEAGSAATQMTTTAIKRGDRYMINGKKHWITGGGISNLHLVFAKIIEDGQELGIGGFIVVREESDGLLIGNREPSMGLRGIPETEVLFKNLEVREDRMLKTPGGLARGFASLMNAYNSQRVGAATVALGIATGAYEEALEYAKTREQFGRPIAEFQGIQWMLADMSIQLAASRAMIHQAVASAGEGFPDRLVAAQAKVLASETAIRVTNDALQIFGAAGYSRNRPLERMVRDARMFAIGGGTAQILRTQIAGSILDMKVPQTRDGYLRAD